MTLSRVIRTVMIACIAVVAIAVVSPGLASAQDACKECEPEEYMGGDGHVINDTEGDADCFIPNTCHYGTTKADPCEVDHSYGNCGGINDDDIDPLVAAVRLGDIGVVFAILDENTAEYLINEDRQALQVLTCTGGVAVHVPADPEVFNALLVDYTEGELP